MKVLLGVTGGVAAVLTGKLVAALKEAGHEVSVITTERAEHFQKPGDIFNLDEYGVNVWTDHDEWPTEQYQKGGIVRHIALREWADVVLIAPLTANTLAKIANGLADNLLTSVMRAWDFQKPVIVAPAMNTLMWHHPVTYTHLKTLEGWWHSNFQIVQPTVKKLACGDTGMGALADLSDIVSAVNCFSA